MKTLIFILLFLATEGLFILSDVYAQCHSCNAEVYSILTIFNFMTEEYPFLVGNATFSINPNPYSGTTNPQFAQFADEVTYTIRDGNKFDADPMKGVIELQDVNDGSYTITVTKGVVGVGLPTQPSSVTVNGTGLAYITNTFIDYTSQNIPIQMPPPIMGGSEKIFSDNILGAKINGQPLTPNNLPPSLQINIENILSASAPETIIFDHTIDSSDNISSIFNTLGIPTYEFPPLITSENTAYIPPLFVTPTTNGTILVLSPILDQIHPESELVMNFDKINSGTLPLKTLSIPFNIEATDVGVKLQIYEGVPSGAPTFTGSAHLFLEVSATNNIDLSDISTFKSNPKLYFVVDRINSSCPSDVSVYLLMEEGKSSAHWHPISTSANLQRETLLDTSSVCGYMFAVDHFSSYLVGTGDTTDHSGHGSSHSGHEGHDHSGHGGHESHAAGSHSGHEGFGGHIIDCTIEGLVHEIGAGQVYLNIHTDSDGNPLTNTGPGDLYNPGEVRGQLWQSVYGFGTLAKPENEILDNSTDVSLWAKSTGKAILYLERTNNHAMKYKIMGSNLPNIVGIHLHSGDKNQNSHIHLVDFIPNNKTKSISMNDGEMIYGTLTDKDICPGSDHAGHLMTDDSDHAENLMTDHSDHAEHLMTDHSDHAGHLMTDHSNHTSTEEADHEHGSQIKPESDLVKMDPEPLLSVPLLKQWAGFSEVSVSDEEFLKNLGFEGTKIPSWFKKSNVSKWVIEETISQRELLDTLKFFEKSGFLA